MKILIQHAETRHFLGKGCRWINGPQGALAFLDEVRARDYCIYHRLTKANVVSLPEDPLQEQLPAPSERSLSTKKQLETENMKSKAVTNRANIPSSSASITPPKTSSKAVEQTPPTTTSKRKNAKATLQKLTPITGKRAATSSSSDTTATSPAARAIAIPAPEPKVTTIAAKIDIGYGNVLFIRGQGDGLSWDKGAALRCVDASTWMWSSDRAQSKVVFKLLINDQVWSQGDDLVVEAGTKAEIVPVFH
ncbi:MAG TPA: hypothetical protein P5186_06230 [Candidatus Paceibacterota bacterium]|nr:hypothetical protein [Verrucomicrobiota bacterium]HRY47626.1 hypothetical protein [Candidatus Paceibacterota bacterium]